MKIGIGLDGLLTDTEQAFVLWKMRQSVQADSFYDPKFIRNESFWMSLKSYPDVIEASKFLSESQIEVYILTERPKSLLPITHAWLRFAGLKNFTVVPQTIKRYDCRLLGLDAMLDSDLEMLRTFVYDETSPVYIDRSGIGELTNGRIKYENSLDEAVRNL